MKELYIKKPVMFTTEGFSETRTFMHLNKHVFQSQ